MTKFQLIQALMTRDAKIVVDGRECILLGVVREDGSGNNFILQVDFEGRKYNVFRHIAE